jgi:hypothetical protein
MLIIHDIDAYDSFAPHWMLLAMACPLLRGMLLRASSQQYPEELAEMAISREGCTKAHSINRTREISDDFSSIARFSEAAS